MLVLDTHALLWWATEPARLSRRIRQRLAEAERLGVPTIVFWELAMLVRRGRLAIDIPIRDWTRQVLAVPRVTQLPLTAEIAVLADSLQMHADPADRFIVATAMVGEHPLATKDRLLQPLPFVETLW
jgi:PIN domain nuclease of toxin-antitoxin system